MKAVIQRVKESSVSIESEIISSIKRGLLILLGVAKGDQKAEADYLSEKVANLRIFEDENGKMNRSILETGGEALVVSQFTLLGDCRKGRRPSFIAAAKPEDANALYEYFANRLEDKGISVQKGKFQAMMDVALVNDGPVTLIVESP
jgi:D-tyrosyl-tRNA(Tyr) deacylase